MITERELLQSSEAQYMNASQQAFFRQRLLQMRNRLCETLDDTGQYLRQLDLLADVFDRASQEESRWLKLRLCERDGAILDEIEAALRRLEAGHYGWCCETGEPIGLRRLLARPTACLCTEAQERRERRTRLQPHQARSNSLEEAMPVY